MSLSTYDNVVVRRAISPAGARTNGTVNGQAIDLGANGGCQSVTVGVITGTLTDGVHTFSVEESDDGSTNWTAVAAGNIQGTATVTAATNDDTQFEFGVRANKRYIRVNCETSGTTTGGIYAAVVVLAGTRAKPVSHS